MENAVSIMGNLSTTTKRTNMPITQYINLVNNRLVGSRCSSTNSEI